MGTSWGAWSIKTTQAVMTKNPTCGQRAITMSKTRTTGSATNSQTPTLSTPNTTIGVRKTRTPQMPRNQSRSRRLRSCSNSISRAEETAEAPDVRCFIQHSRQIKEQQPDDHHKQQEQSGPDVIRANTDPQTNKEQKKDSNRRHSVLLTIDWFSGRYGT